MQYLSHIMVLILSKSEPNILLFIQIIKIYQILHQSFALNILNVLNQKRFISSIFSARGSSQARRLNGWDQPAEERGSKIRFSSERQVRGSTKPGNVDHFRFESSAQVGIRKDDLHERLHLRRRPLLCLPRQIQKPSRLSQLSRTKNIFMLGGKVFQITFELTLCCETMTEIKCYILEFYSPSSDHSIKAKSDKKLSVLSKRLTAILWTSIYMFKDENSKAFWSP